MGRSWRSGRKDRDKCKNRDAIYFHTMPTTPAETKKTRKKYTPLERRLRKLGSGGAGGDLRNDTVPSAQLPIVNAYFSTPPSSSRSRNMVPLPNGNASSTSSSSSSDSNFSSDLSDSLYSSGSECIYTDGSDSDDDSDNGEDWTDPFRLATEGYRFVHMGNFGKLVHRTIPCAECQERRFTNVLDTINSKKKPGKKALRENIKSLRKTPMMHLLSEKHNGFASTITFGCLECGLRSTFNTSPTFRPYKYSGVLATVPLRAADADDGILYDGDAEDNAAVGGDKGSDDDGDNDRGGLGSDSDAWEVGVAQGGGGSSSAVAEPQVEAELNRTMSKHTCYPECRSYQCYANKDREPGMKDAAYDRRDRRRYEVNSRMAMVCAGNARSGGGDGGDGDGRAHGNSGGGGGDTAVTVARGLAAVSAPLRSVRLRRLPRA